MLSRKTCDDDLPLNVLHMQRYPIELDAFKMEFIEVKKLWIRRKQTQMSYSLCSCCPGAARMQYQHKAASKIVGNCLKLQIPSESPSFMVVSRLHFE